MIEGIIDDEDAVLWSNDSCQVFFSAASLDEVIDEETCRQNGTLWTRVRLPYGEVRAHFLHDIRLSNGDPNTVPVARQYCVSLSQGTKILCGPDVRLTDPPEEYCSDGRFTTYRNRVNDEWHARLVRAIKDQTELPSHVMRAYLSCSYEWSVAASCYRIARLLERVPVLATTVRRVGLLLDPHKEPVELLRVLDRLERRAPTRAKAYLNDALALHPDAPELLERKAAYLVGEDKMDEAIETLQRANDQLFSPQRARVQARYEFMRCGIG